MSLHILALDRLDLQHAVNCIDVRLNASDPNDGVGDLPLELAQLAGDGRKPIIVFQVLLLRRLQPLLHAVLPVLGRADARLEEMKLLLGLVELLPRAFVLALDRLHLFQKYGLEVFPRTQNFCACTLDLLLNRTELVPGAFVGLPGNRLQPIQDGAVPALHARELASQRAEFASEPRTDGHNGLLQIAFAAIGVFTDNAHVFRRYGYAITTDPVRISVRHVRYAGSVAERLNRETPVALLVQAHAEVS